MEIDSCKSNENLESNPERKPSDDEPDVSTIFQSIRIRYSSIFPNRMVRKFMDRQCDFVLYCGTFFWLLYLITS